MKILMIYPKYPITYWSFKYALDFIDKKAFLPPLGLLTIANMLPSDWDIRLIDMNVEQPKDSLIKEADYIMVSAMSVQRESAEEVISRCQAMNKKVICGGPLFSSEPERYDYVDHLLLYEAEDNIEDFLNDLKLGQAKHIYNKQSFPDFSKTPVPRWDLIKLDSYKAMGMQTSRGCPFNCEFCDVIQLFGHKLRTKSLEQILAELDAIYDAGWRGDVGVCDDNFIGNKAFVKNELLPGIIKWMKKYNYPFGFTTEISINIADDDELLDMMVQAGFGGAFIGVETIDDSCLEECGKTQNRSRDTLSCIHKIQEHGLQIYGGFIVGFDNDKPDVFQKMFDFIQKSGIIVSTVSLLTAPPNTRLYERLKSQGRIKGDYSGDMCDTNIVPLGNQDTLINGYKKLLHDIYESKNYYQRVRTFFEHYNYPNLYQENFGYKDVKAFFKACYLMGIKDKNRKYFWSILGYTLKQFKEKPWMFSGAVIYAIMGYHFRKYTTDDIY